MLQVATCFGETVQSVGKYPYCQSEPLNNAKAAHTLGVAVAIARFWESFVVENKATKGNHLLKRVQTRFTRHHYKME